MAKLSKELGFKYYTPQVTRGGIIGDNVNWKKTVENITGTSWYIYLKGVNSTLWCTPPTLSARLAAIFVQIVFIGCTFLDLKYY